MGSNGILIWKSLSIVIWRRTAGTKKWPMVPDSEWDDERAISDSASTRLIPRHMHALAYYTAAIGLRKCSHVPIIGPSLERHMGIARITYCISYRVYEL